MLSHADFERITYVPAKRVVPVAERHPAAGVRLLRWIAFTFSRRSRRSPRVPKVYAISPGVFDCDSRCVVWQTRNAKAKTAQTNQLPTAVLPYSLL